MSARIVHFVGSFPAASTDDAMRAMLDGAGGLMRTLPTGETRRYEWYILPIIDDLVKQGALEVRKSGTWNTPRDRDRYRVPRGIELTGDMMALPYPSETEEALPVFSGLRTARGLPELSLQIGMPTDFTLALVALGIGGLRSHRKAFRDATVRDIHAVRAAAGDDVVVQLEAPGEMVVMAKTQPLHRRAEAALGLARGITELAAAAPEGTRFGVHLCVGSMRNKAGAQLRDTRPLVCLANAIARQWPSGRRLEFVHAPLAAGEIPPPERPEFYTPLGELELGPDTRFHAGFIHETPTEATQVETLGMIEAALGRPVDGVASACGLGRRPRPVAEAMVERAALLAVK
ncbi:hypothetical protein [Nocardia inohanensis]|uniref:hypothetical protein n=1 Tax=Nocardia inohanensis TaxID=209246 RepID=UPI0008361147|nr:hypothetical protein [Nocardia inohanensis]